VNNVLSGYENGLSNSLNPRGSHRLGSFHRVHTYTDEDGNNVVHYDESDSNKVYFCIV
jgi:hypothetical protein